MRCFLLFFLFLSGITLFGQRFSERKIKKQLKAIAAFEQAHVALSVQSQGNTKALIDYQGGRYMTPASNIKLLTFLAAQQQFDSLPALFYRAKGDSLIQFASSGYPLLFHPFYPDSTLHAFFNKEVQWEYISHSKKPHPFGKGWSWDDYHYYYAAPKSIFPVYGNSLQVVKTNNEIQVNPPYFRLSESKDSLAPKIYRDPYQNKFTINKTRWEEKDTLYHPFIPSDSLLVSLLSAALKKPVIKAMIAPSSTQWKSLYTKADEKLYRALLQNSDNGIAEALLLMIAYKTNGEMQTDLAIDTILREWNTWLPDPVEWVDGSGVSRYNMVTPRVLVEVLQKIYESIGWQEITTLFPQGGVSGTLKSYPLPNIYAKTGTLKHNHNVSGYLLNNKGKLFVFSIMVNHFTAPPSAVKEGISDLLRWMQKKLK